MQEDGHLVRSSPIYLFRRSERATARWSGSRGVAGSNDCVRAVELEPIGPDEGAEDGALRQVVLTRLVFRPAVRSHAPEALFLSLGAMGLHGRPHFVLEASKANQEMTAYPNEIMNI